MPGMYAAIRLLGMEFLQGQACRAPCCDHSVGRRKMTAGTLETWTGSYFKRFTGVCVFWKVQYTAAGWKNGGTRDGTGNCTGCAVALPKS